MTEVENLGITLLLPAYKPEFVQWKHKITQGHKSIYCSVTVY